MQSCVVCSTFTSILASGVIEYSCSPLCFTRLAGRLFGPGEEGENWWDDKCLFHPIVVKDPSSSSWRMYYYGRNRDSWHSGVTPALLSTGRIGLALSEDGLRWTRYRGALPEGAILDPDDGSPSFDSVHIGCSDVFFHEGKEISPAFLLYLTAARFSFRSIVTSGNVRETQMQNTTLWYTMFEHIIKFYIYTHCWELTKSVPACHCR